MSQCCVNFWWHNIVTLKDSKLVFMSSSQNNPRVHSGDDNSRRRNPDVNSTTCCRSQGAALQFQVNLHLLFLHDFLQFCRSSCVLKGKNETVVFVSLFSKQLIVQMQSTPLPPAVLFARSADCTLWRPLLESLHVAPLCWGRRAGPLLTLPDMWLSWGTKQHRFNSFYSTALLKWTCKLLSHYFSSFTQTLKKKKATTLTVHWSLFLWASRLLPLEKSQSPEEWRSLMSAGWTEVCSDWPFH